MMNEQNVAIFVAGCLLLLRL